MASARRCVSGEDAAARWRALPFDYPLNPQADRTRDTLIPTRGATNMRKRP